MSQPLRTLPPAFVASIAQYPGLAEALANTQPEVSIRVNKGKGYAVPDGCEPVAWCAEGFYLPSRPQFALDPAWHQARYYVQDASSMYLAQVLKALPLTRPIRFLDACAAPGGKTTLAIDNLPAGSLVVANEFVPKRAAILRENIEKYGNPNCVVTQGDTARFKGARTQFDVILCDAPCSGEGMMRKDPEAVAQWSPELVAQCAARQHEIVDNLWAALSPGGWLIYSTCTFNHAENEDIIAYLQQQYQAEVTLPPRRFLPGTDRGEGLCMAMVQKPGQLTATPMRTAARPQRRQQPAPIPITEGDYVFEEHGDNLVAIPSAFAADVAQLRRDVNVIAAGVTVATIIRGRDPKKPVYVPAHTLAMSSLYKRGTYPEVDVDTPTAQQYLRGQAITLPEDTPKGFVTLIFDGMPLGFVKNLGNRCNNLYPVPWRIKNL